MPRVKKSIHHPALPCGPGTGTTCLQCGLLEQDYDPNPDEFGPPVTAAIAQILAQLAAKLPVERDRLAILPHIADALRTCARHVVHPLALANRCVAEAWFREQALEHVAACAKPDECDDAVCRRARGLAPLTAGEIRAGKYMVDGHQG
jgi:hypothetical protein